MNLVLNRSQKIIEMIYKCVPYDPYFQVFWSNMKALCEKQNLIHQKSQHLALNEESVVICRYVLKLNQIWLIIDERYKVIELNLNKHWTGLRWIMTLLSFWAALEKNCISYHFWSWLSYFTVYYCKTTLKQIVLY